MKNLFKSVIISTLVFATSVFANTYTVKYGDSFLGIALRHGMTQTQLQNLNPSIDIERLKAGTRLEVGNSKTVNRVNTQQPTTSSTQQKASSTQQKASSTQQKASSTQTQSVQQQVVQNAVILERVQQVPQYNQYQQPVVQQVPQYNQYQQPVVQQVPQYNQYQQPVVQQVPQVPQYQQYQQPVVQQPIQYQQYQVPQYYAPIGKLVIIDGQTYITQPVQTIR